MAKFFDAFSGKVIDFNQAALPPKVRTATMPLSTPVAQSVRSKVNAGLGKGNAGVFNNQKKP